MSTAPPAGAQARMQRGPGPWLLAVVAAGILGQGLLALNPGYFSHDELQWAAFGHGELASLAWVDPRDLSQLQYRPLTFNLWLLLGNALFAHPQAFHALWVALGTANALLLCLLLGRLGLRPAFAALGALVFVLNPFSAYVHGWVGTLGDLLWVAALLCIGLLASGQGRMPWRAVLVGLLAALALLAKESAIVVPGLCGLAWLLLPRKRHWLAATLASALPVVAYLALRMQALAEVPADSAYAWRAGNIPGRLLEYHLYPFIPTLFEPQPVLAASPGRLAMAATLAVATLACLWRAHWRLAAGLLAGGTAALGPVLLLDFSAAQYGYGFGMLAAALVAAAAMRLRGLPAWRVVLALAVVMLLWHGFNVQRTMRQVGELESRFSPQLAALATRPGDTLRLYPGHGYAWAYRRLSHDIPAYRGRPYVREVEIVTDGMAADHVIAADGSIHPLAPGG